MDLLLTGRWLEPGEAMRWGLVREVVAGDALMTRARDLAATLAAGPPLVYAAIKDVLRRTEALTVQAGFDLLRSGSVETVETLYRSEDLAEGARAFAEGRDPVWRGR